jgi:hypothetical protein
MVRWQDLRVLVTLMPGVDPRRVQEVLFERKTTITNNSGNLAGYLDWALETARVLRNQIRQSDIDRLVFTPRLWRLHELAGYVGSFQNSLLSAELTEQADVFNQAWEALQAEINRWNPAMAELVVVDTSVFIRHPDKIRDIEYAALTGARSEPVRLVVPRIVVDELDRLKDSGPQEVRWRAGHTLGVLDELLVSPKGRASIREADDFSVGASVDGMPRGRVTVEVLFDDPRHVRLDDNDDEIIDRALALQAYAGQRVHLLTMDTSMGLRGRMLDLQVHKVPRPLGNEPAPASPKPARGDGRAPAQH